MFFIVLGAVLWVILALWPAFMARRKGYSFLLFFILAVFISWLLTLIIVSFLEDKNETAASKAADRAAERALEKEERG